MKRFRVLGSHATLMIGIAEHSKKRLFQESLEFFLLVPLMVKGFRVFGSLGLRVLWSQSLWDWFLNLGS